ncbi:MAG: hypothetical protein SWK76_15910 [Actinomycetota bacterium]|nr:hypothetical protein [Actinomycetota bacterium]
MLWESGELRDNPLAFIKDIEGLPAPDHVQIDQDLFWRRRGTEGLPGLTAMQARRGCDRRCIYLFHPGSGGPQVEAQAQ